MVAEAAASWIPRLPPGKELWAPPTLARRRWSSIRVVPCRGQADLLHHLSREGPTHWPRARSLGWQPLPWGKTARPAQVTAKGSPRYQAGAPRARKETPPSQLSLQVQCGESPASLEGTESRSSRPVELLLEGGVGSFGATEGRARNSNPLKAPCRTERQCYKTCHSEGNLSTKIRGGGGGDGGGPAREPP